MFSNRKHFVLAAGLALGMSGAAITGDIVDTAAKAGNFNTLKLDDACVITKNVVADNGIIHAIDKAVLPK